MIELVVEVEKVILRKNSESSVIVTSGNPVDPERRVALNRIGDVHLTRIELYLENINQETASRFRAGQQLRLSLTPVTDKRPC